LSVPLEEEVKKVKLAKEFKEVPASTARELNVFKCATNTANSIQREGVNPKAYINYIFRGKICVYAKGVSSK
jgi:hypothetical protein